MMCFAPHSKDPSCQLWMSVMVIKMRCKETSRFKGRESTQWTTDTKRGLGWAQMSESDQEWESSTSSKGRLPTVPHLECCPKEETN